jgi:hypothetical protein
MLLIDIVCWFASKNWRGSLEKIDSFFKRKTCEDERYEDITTPASELVNDLIIEIEEITLLHLNLLLFPKLKSLLLMNSSLSKRAMCHFKVF